MSGNDNRDSKDTDRRTQKTRKALLDSLIGLVHQRRYDEFAVGDIVDEAKVGRSTFYEHYRSKDDMLVETMGDMLAVMASVASEHATVEPLEMVLRHFQENRKFARHCFSSSAGLPVFTRMTRELEKLIEAHLKLRQEKRGVSPSIPLALIATQVADGQFALIRAWLVDEQGCTPLELATAMHASAAASIGALVR